MWTQSKQSELLKNYGYMALKEGNYTGGIKYH